MQIVVIFFKISISFPTTIYFPKLHDYTVHHLLCYIGYNKPSLPIFDHLFHVLLFLKKNFISL